ncbi:unnamed protein product [Rotaria magnacalcarata]|uniref:Uncharacterized protein n=1 Tax=Rotaria magnacalcarata TaxID=392030 RepID=A0A819PQS6_9BILA|nr:unnamed protein product [Rotaria magnacalcarata]CAF4014780.1 unnamed protein product [Rotaria magnacalcarata]
MPIAEDLVEQLQIQKLIYAVRTENILLVQKLCGKGVKNLVNLNDPRTGMTPLIAAVTQSNTEMIQCLLELRANPDAIDFSGRTPLMHAAESGQLIALELLREAEANPTIQDFEGRDAIYYACTETKKDHKEFFKKLLDMGANVNNQDKNGVPTLVHVCEESDKNEDVCMELIRRGANVRLADESTKRTALHNACYSGNVKVVRELLRAKADPDALDNKKSTPAHEAAKGGNLKVIILLSSVGTRFDVYDYLGNNPIHYAAMADAGSALRFLGQRGCNPKVKNNDGRLPRQIAVRYRNRDALKNIRKAEQGYHEMNSNLPTDDYRDWRLMLHDYIYEHHSRIEKLFQAFDTGSSKHGFMLKENFKKILEGESHLSFLQSYNYRDLNEKHDISREELDYKAFLTGAKYLARSYLITSFIRKTKKKPTT